MRYETFLSAVEHEAGVPEFEAEWAIRATLLTLGERLSSGETHDLGRRLPFILGAYIENDDDAEPFGADEFLRRVAAREREPVTIPTAERHARGVFAAIGRAIDGKELHDMRSELSDDYAPLLATTRARDEIGDAPILISYDAFLTRVGQRTGLDRIGAERATDAVLEALGERVARGEIEDIERELPRELRVPLERGEAVTGGQARRMPLDAFVQHIAELEAASAEEALLHAEGVLATLRETVSAKELDDLTAQLPRDYAELFARP